MNYFLTGGTGFIGRFLVEKLLARGGTVHVLVAVLVELPPAIRTGNVFLAHKIESTSAMDVIPISIFFL